MVIEVDQELEELVQRAEAEWIERFVAGPKQLRWDELPPQVGDPAPDLEIRDSTGTRRQLHELWADGPALLLFWRHFGCGCGLDRADRLAGEHDDYLDAGATIAIVGEGDPERGAVYREEYDIDCPVLCDPDGGAHETYGLLDFTIAQTLYHLPGLVDRDREVVEAVAERKRDEGLPQVDNPWRQPGEFVVDEDGVLRLAYRYQYCRDFPDPRVLLTAIREAKR